MPRKRHESPEEKNDSGNLFYDFKNKAAGKGTSFGEKEQFAFRHIKVIHELIPGAAGYLDGPEGCQLGSLHGELSNLRYGQLR